MNRFYINAINQHRRSPYFYPVYTHKTPDEPTVALSEEKKVRFLWNSCPHPVQMIQRYIPSATRQT